MILYKFIVYRADKAIYRIYHLCGDIELHVQNKVKMAAEAAALLDQLMGSTRNAAPGDNVKQADWWDSEVG